MCGAEERARFLALVPGTFPATALPPPGLVQGPGLIRLRRALANREWVLAEELWDGLLRTVQPLGAAGRSQLAECFEAYACLKDALGKPAEAERFRHRAESARKDPSHLNRHVPLGKGAAAGVWDSRARMRRRFDSDERPSAAVLSKVRALLDREDVLERRRKIILTLGSGGLAGVLCAAFTDLPTGVMALVGVGMGWLLWARKL
ncbi:MAG TPA: hypothetical protein VK786_04530 [bacterium]|nr:hypothetical protein [bacterium]